MKKITLIISNFIFFISVQSCEIKNTDFDFKYSLDENNKTLSYQIKRKDNSNFNYYYLGKSEQFLGFYLLNRPPVIIKNEYNATVDKYRNFINEKNFYQKELFLIQSTNPSMNDFDYLKKTNIINKKFNYEDFLEDIQHSQSKPISSGQQKIKFKIKLVLDKEINECLKFETKEVIYDFGSKWKWYLKDLISIIK